MARGQRPSLQGGPLGRCARPDLTAGRAVSHPARACRTPRAHFRENRPRQGRGRRLGALHRVVPDPCRRVSGHRQRLRRAGDAARATEAFERCLSFSIHATASCCFSWAWRTSTPAGMPRRSPVTRSRSTLDPVRNRQPARSRPPGSPRQPDCRSAGGGRRGARNFSHHTADALLLAGLVAERGRALTGCPRIPRTGSRGRAESTSTSTSRSGRLESSAGRRAEARRHFERALQLDPARRAENCGVARADRAWSLMRLAWSRTIADRVLVRYCRLLPAQRHPVRIGAIPQARPRAGAGDLRRLAPLDLRGRACCSRESGLAPWLAIGTPSRRRLSSPHGPSWRSRCSSRLHCLDSRHRRPRSCSRCCRSCRPCGYR